MSLSPHPAGIFMRFLPFWVFLVFFKFGGGLHYSLLAPLGEKVMPLWLVGILVGSSSIIQLLLDVPAGHILDRYGYRRFLKITTVIFAVAAGCYFFGFNKTTYIISLAVSTFGWLFFGPGINAYILSHAPKDAAGKFISLRDVFGSVGVVLASVSLPAAMVIAPEYYGALILILLATAFVMLCLSPKDTVSVHAEIKIPTQHHYIRRKKITSAIQAMKRLNPASGMLLLLNISGSIFYSTIWFVVPLVIAHQINDGVLGIGLGTFDLSIVILGFVIGKLADKINRRLLVFFGLLIFAVSGMFIGFHLTWLFILFGFLATTGDEMASISLWSWLHALDKDHDHDGAISGVLNLFLDLGWAIGPICAGVLYTVIGPSWTILLSAIPVFLVWIVYQQFMSRHPARHIHVADLPAKPHRARHRT